MIKSKRTSISKKSRPFNEPAADPAEQEEETQETSKKPDDEGFDKLDNQYEAAGFALSTILKNWEKFLILVLAVLITIGIILLLLLPGYKCQTETRTFEKSPVNIPVKKHNSSTEGE